MLPKWWPLILGLLVFSGCLSPVREETDQAICQMAAHPLDPQPLLPADQANTPPSEEQAAGPEKPSSEALTGPGEPTLPQPKPVPGGQMSLGDRLKIPPELQRFGGKPLDLPTDPAARKEYLQRLYPPLPPLGPNPQPLPGPNGKPLTLADLQNLATTNSPLLRQAASDVVAARGAALQAGAYPNPNFGYQWDTAGTGATAGFQGVFVEQVIKTAGKLKLSQAVAIMDLLNAQLAQRRAQTDLAAQVRSAYFAVLVAQETIKVTEALARLTDEAYRIQLVQTRIIAAPYEPLQLRVLSFQARDALVQARNTYTGTWKQLAATLGLPALPPTEVVGRVDQPIPVFRYDLVLTRVLSNHTDVLTAENTIQRARYNLELAKATPVPDVSVHVAVEKDFTVPPFNTTTSGTIGVPLPIWDRNKGAIMQAQGQLVRAVEEPHRVRDDLTSRLADAFRRYDSNRIRLALYRDQILPDQLRAYQGVRARHNVAPDEVSFGDVVTAQQTLAGVITTYVAALGDMWTAVVDVANLLQTNDLFQVGLEADQECVHPVPDLDHLAPLPCCHPCSPLPDPGLKGADGHWPAALPFGNLAVPMPEKEPKAEPSPPAPLPPESSPELPPATNLPVDPAEGWE